MRKPVLKPFNDARSLGVILNLSNSNCPDTVAFLNQEAARHGIKIHYLLVNLNRHPIPQWCLDPRMTVINYRHDFTYLGKLKSAIADEFINTEFDFLFAVSNNFHPVVNRLSKLSKACFKVGKYFSRDNPYDLTYRPSFSERDMELSKEYVANIHLITLPDHSDN
jgi:hypothetical protein